MVALMRWATTIGADPQEMLLNPASGIAPVERMLDGEDVAGLPADDRNWVTSHLLAHVAAILMHNHGGGWAVDDDPDSPSYTRYVIDADGTYYDPTRAVAGLPEVAARRPRPRRAHRGRRSAPHRACHGLERDLAADEFRPERQSSGHEQDHARHRARPGRHHL